VSYTVHGYRHDRIAKVDERFNPSVATPVAKRQTYQIAPDRDTAERLAKHLVESDAYDTATFWENL